MSKLNKKKNSAPKSRKEVRKNKRKEKKQRKFEYYNNKNKTGKFVRNINKKDINNDVNTKTKTNKKDFKNGVNNKTKSTKSKEFNIIDSRTKELKAERELQRQMSKQRKKQLQAANDDEDKNIKHLEKQLKLNKRKNKSIPKTFAADGLDYLLEVCDPENMKSVAAAEQQFTGLNDDFEDDFALITENNKKKDKEATQTSESANEDKSEDEFSADEDEFSDKSSENENLDLDSDQNSDLSSDIENNKNKRKNINSNNKNSKKLKKSVSDLSEDSDESLEEEEDLSNIENDLETNETWEDIYGRTRTKDGEVLNSNTGKYIPPALRNQNSSVNQKEAEKIARIRKQLKGLLNRLAESNMHSISTEIEQMYMTNSRNNMNETFTKLIFEALITPVLTPERLLLEYTFLVTILHANVGTEVGAHFLQSIIQKFEELYNKDDLIENKELDNTVVTIAQLYNFKLFHSQLLYQILGRLEKKFEEKHVECILLVLKSVGFSLRKDDPLALKQLIVDLQKKASTVSNDNSRVKFMLDILLAIKNNNVTKIPNYDTSYSEHLKKLSKNFIRKGNYVTQLNISLDDLLKAEERGRWWIVGSAWTGNEDKKQENNEIKTIESTYNKRLLDLARKQRMNTDTRRNIFCILMTAENYVDAFEKILNLALKNQQERDIIHVLLHCSLQEKDYNPYYSLVAQKFCEFDRKYQMMIRCSVWDKLKTLSECSGKQISILAKLLTHLFLKQALPISTLKVIQFSELDQTTLRLIRQVLLGILLHSDEETCLEVFQKILTPKLKTFRESLRLFIHHFLLRNLNSSDLTEKKDLLVSRAKSVENCLTSTENKTKF